MTFSEINYKKSYINILKWKYSEGFLKTAIFQFQENFRLAIFIIFSNRDTGFLVKFDQIIINFNKNLKHHCNLSCI